MECIIDRCEFYNVVLGGIIVGIITSILFYLLTRIFQIWKFKCRYNYLQSRSDNEFDWEAYSMKEEDNRVQQETPNGSFLNVRIKKDRIFLKLKQSNNEIWYGELNIMNFKFGVVSYKYQSRHEYGKRECIIGNYSENGQTFDYLFLSPINNKIYYIENIDEKKQRVVYNYGYEIFIRKRLRS